MRKQYLFYALFFWGLHSVAQTTNTPFIGAWKCYLADSATFEFLNLNADGSGIKGFGKTIEGRDKIFMDNVSLLTITHWFVKGDTIIMLSESKAHFQANPQYRYVWKEGGYLELDGEHILLGIYPSYLTKDQFQRTVVYQKADLISHHEGTSAGKCIVDDLTLFKFSTLDSTWQMAEYKGHEDLIPDIVSCGAQYQYINHYNDVPFSLMIPRSVQDWSFGYGDMSFYISLNSIEKDDPVTSIVIHYDFNNELRGFYFSQMHEGKRERDSVLLKGKCIYKTKNWQGKYEGDLFLDHSLIVSYYTKDEKQQEMLQNCIASFKYKE